MVLHGQIRTGSDSVFSDQDWTQTEEFRSPLTCDSQRWICQTLDLEMDINPWDFQFFERFGWNLDFI